LQILHFSKPKTVINNKGVATVTGHGHRWSPGNRRGYCVVNRLDDWRMIWAEVDDRERVFCF